MGAISNMGFKSRGATRLIIRELFNYFVNRMGSKLVWYRLFYSTACSKPVHKLELAAMPKIKFLNTRTAQPASSAGHRYKKNFYSLCDAKYLFLILLTRICTFDFRTMEEEEEDNAE